MQSPNQPVPAEVAGASSSLANQIAGSELVVVALLTLFAAALRLAHLDHIAVEHFDEGVYAANFYAEHLENQFPDRHLYAPPLLPLLIEYSIVYGRGLHAAMWVNLMAGILLVPALWWTGRSWFGPIAGLTAAALCTFSDVHVLYSRTALTDPLLALFLVLSVHMIWRTVCQGGIITAVVSGLLVGAAWWTKYNGWLPLAIALAGFAGWMLWGVLPESFADDEPASRRERRKNADSRLSRVELLKVLAPRVLIVCVVSIACWAPYLWKLQSTGGYAAVAANHTRYVVGVAGWGSAFVAQARNLKMLEGPLTAAGMLVLAALIILLANDSVRRRSQTVIAIGLAATALTAWLGSAALLLAASVWGLMQVFTARSTSVRETAAQSENIKTSESNLAAWMLAAWFIGLLVTTPLYHPYSRLTLPWLAAAWLMAGLSASLLMQRMTRPSDNQIGQVATDRNRWIWSIVATSVAILIWQAPQLAARGVSGWEDRSQIESISQRLIEYAAMSQPEWPDNDPDQVDAVFYVLAEPAMFVHLSARQIQSEFNYIAQPASSLAVTALAVDPGFTVYLIVGPHALSDEEELAKVSNIELVGSVAYRPSKLVWLDEYPGRPFAEWDADDSKWQFRLYRVTPQ